MWVGAVVTEDCLFEQKGSALRVGDEVGEPLQYFALQALLNPNDAPPRGE